MGKLVEAVHVTLGGEVGSTDWARPYLDEQHSQYAMNLSSGADALLLGRLTYEGLSAAYTRMAEEAESGAPRDFIDRMNSIPKFVPSRTLRELTWNAEVIEGDVASFVEELKRKADLLKYGNGPLDATLIEHGLIDEFHLFLTPSRSALASTCSRASTSLPIFASSMSPASTAACSPWYTRRNNPNPGRKGRRSRRTSRCPLGRGRRTRASRTAGP